MIASLAGAAFVVAGHLVFAAVGLASARAIDAVYDTVTR